MKKMIAPHSSHGCRMLTTALTCLVALTTLLSSCDEYLTDDPHTQMTPEEAFGTVDRLKNNALLTVYNYIGAYKSGEGLQGTDRGLYDLNSFTTDEQFLPTRSGDWYDNGLWYRLFYHLWTPGEGPIKNTWDYLFKVVILCNEGIEHIEEFPVTHNCNEYDLERLVKYKAELRGVRAMFYFYLMDLFGRVPLITNTNVKSNELTLTNRSQLFYWIYGELNDVLPHLEVERSQLPKSEFYGRFTVYPAYFVMMKLALNAEIYTDDDWTDNVYPDGKDIRLTTYDIFEGCGIEGNAWETVMAIQEHIGSAYSLAEFYSDNFDVTNELSPENIFVIPMDVTHFTNKYDYFIRSRHYCHGAALGGRGDNGACATLSTVRTFGYAENDVLGRDVRFAFNFYYEDVTIGAKTVYEDDGVTPLYYHPLAVDRFDLSTTKYEKTAGARLAKYSIDATSRADGRLGNNDIVLFRYGDVLLMSAEAAYRLGMKENALTTLNQVYHRANINYLEDISEDILLNERLKELMWEGWRRNDLIRFHRYHLDYDLKVASEHESDAHTIVFPIPADMMKMHPNWQQNPGY